MDANHLTLGIPYRAAAGTAGTVEGRMNITGMALAFVDIDIRHSAEFDGIFLPFVIADKKQLVTHGQVVPWTAFDGL